MIMIGSNFIFHFTNFCVIFRFFLIKLLTSNILFSTAVSVVEVAKLVILGISFFTSFTLILRTVVEAKLLVLRISFLF